MPFPLLAIISLETIMKFITAGAIIAYVCRKWDSYEYNQEFEAKVNNTCKEIIEEHERIEANHEVLVEAHNSLRKQITLLTQSNQKRKTEISKLQAILHERQSDESIHNQDPDSQLQSITDAIRLTQERESKERADNSK